MRSPTVLDVAAFVISECGPMGAMRLHGLLDHIQREYMISVGDTLFYDKPESWAYGPVYPRLYDTHRGLFVVSEMHSGDSTVLSAEQAAVVRAILSDRGITPRAS